MLPCSLDCQICGKPAARCRFTMPPRLWCRAPHHCGLCHEVAQQYAAGLLYLVLLPTGINRKEIN